MTQDLEALLPEAGPWLLFLMAAAETAFVTGLAVPAGVATSLGGVLASRGHLTLTSVAFAACAGAAAGDSLGFWLGRRYGRGVLEGGGRLRRLARRHEPGISAIFGRHPIYAVTLARLVSFVRTLMPWAAGTSRLAYPRFLAYDLLGIAFWGTAYLAVGYLADQSWRWVSGAVGAAWAALFFVVGGIGWIVARYRAIHAPPDAPAGTGGGSTDSRRSPGPSSPSDGSSGDP